MPSELFEVYIPDASEVEICQEAITDNGPKTTVIRSPLGTGGIINENKRYYPPDIYEREANKIKALAEQGELPGNVDHPYGPEGQNRRLMGAGVRYRKIDVQRTDGIVRMTCEAVVLKNQFGDQIQSWIDSGGKIGFSTRGYGDRKIGTVNGVSGVEIIQDNYRMVAPDVVLGPADRSTVNNQITLEQEAEMEVKTLEEFKTKYPELYKQFVGEAAEDKGVIEAVQARLKPDLEAEVKKIAEDAKARIELEARAASDEEWRAKLDEAQKQGEAALAVVASMRKALVDAKFVRIEASDPTKTPEQQSEAMRIELDDLKKRLDCLEGENAGLKKRIADESLRKALAEAVKTDDPQVRQWILDVIGPRLDKGEFQTSDAVEKAVAETRQHAQRLIESKVLAAGPSVGKARTADPNAPDPSLIELSSEKKTQDTWAEQMQRL